MTDAPEQIWIAAPQYSAVDGSVLPGTYTIKGDWCFKHEYRRADLPGPVRVKPLVWEALGDKWQTVTSGRIQITQRGCSPHWDLSCASPETDGYYPTLEAAKAAAQAAHEARIRAALEAAKEASDE